jgi:hypothetical protein
MPFLTGVPGGAVHHVGRRRARLGAVLVAVCVLSHLAMVHAGAAQRSSVSTALAVGMAALCLPCTERLWRRPDSEGWRMAAVMAAVMLAVSALMSLTPGRHAHGGDSAGSMAAVGTGAATLLLLIGGAMMMRPPGPAPADAPRPAWRLRHDRL